MGDGGHCTGFVVVVAVAVALGTRRRCMWLWCWLRLLWFLTVVCSVVLSGNVRDVDIVIGIDIEVVESAVCVLVSVVDCCLEILPIYAVVVVIYLFLCWLCEIYSVVAVVDLQ